MKKTTSLLSNINSFMFHRFELWIKVLVCTLYLCSFSERRVIWGLVHSEPGESPCPHISMTPLQYGLLLSNASNSRWNFFHPQCICKVLFQYVPHLPFVRCLCIMNSLMMWMMRPVTEDPATHYIYMIPSIRITLWSLKIDCTLNVWLLSSMNFLLLCKKWMPSKTNTCHIHDVGKISIQNQLPDGYLSLNTESKLCHIYLCGFPPVWLFWGSNRWYALLHSSHLLSFHCSMDSQKTWKVIPVTEGFAHKLHV